LATGTADVDFDNVSLGVSLNADIRGCMHMSCGGSRTVVANTDGCGADSDVCLGENTSTWLLDHD
jgi:hypothetical protein